MDPYQALIEDTLTYVRGLLPKKSEKIKVELPPPPPAAAPMKPKVKPKLEIIGTPPQEEKSPPPKPKETAGPFLELEPPKVPALEPTESLRALLKEIDPDLYLHESIPSDHGAQRIKNAWKEKRDTPSIPILFQGQGHRPFVTEIAKAIDTVYGSCRIVEIEPGKKWDLFLQSENLKLILIPDTLLFATKELLPFYQENPQQKSRKLGEVPLLLLPDLSLYQKDPYLKRALWSVITTALIQT